MKHIIIGTAGHIDHGKTTLIKALTGRNTDRWEEERRRGITIDLGFTYFDLPNGDRVGIIDVPGHENFINNMVAGVVGMDMVLLVIAADEGIMPQTREHVDILSLLGIEKSIIVLNKCDLVDEDWLEMVQEDIREELKGSVLENAPMVKVSSATGEGLPALVELIEKMTSTEINEKNTQTTPRLPIDRVFTIQGFGTIITGTLISGTIHKGDTLEIYPNGLECKIRNIQVHGENADECYAGQRVALNLSNIKKEDISRGCVIAPVNAMHNTRFVDVRMHVLESSARTITNQMRLHLFTGTQEILCRAVLLDKQEIGPGESGLVQLRLEEETALRKGDRFVVRFYSPLETIGGGEVLEPNPAREKRFNTNVIQGLEQKESGSLEDVAELHIRQAKGLVMTEKELAKLSGATLEEVKEAVDHLEAENLVHRYATQKDIFLWDTAKEAAMQGEIRAALETAHRKHPYRPGMRKEEVRSTFMKEAKPALFDMVLENWENGGKVKRVGEFLALPEYEIPRDGEYDRIAGKILTTFEKAGFDFVWFTDIQFSKKEADTVEDIMQLLLSENRIVKVADNQYTLSSYMEEAKQKIIEKLQKDKLITIIEVRDMFATTRRCAKPILEYMDSIKVTKKTGGESERVPFATSMR